MLLLVLGLVGCAPQRDTPKPAPTRPSETVQEGPGADLRRVLIRSRVMRIRSDGSYDWPLFTPLQASLAFGGLVLLVGGVGTLWLWRRAEPEDTGDPEGVIRNSAAPPARH